MQRLIQGQGPKSDVRSGAILGAEQSLIQGQVGINSGIVVGLIPDIGHFRGMNMGKFKRRVNLGAREGEEAN